MTEITLYRYTLLIRYAESTRHVASESIGSIVSVVSVPAYDEYIQTPWTSVTEQELRDGKLWWSLVYSSNMRLDLDRHIHIVKTERKVIVIEAQNENL